MKRSLLLFVVFSVLGFTTTTKSQINIKANPVALGIPYAKWEEPDTLSNKLINIAFFGVDRRSTSDFGNSDIIMVVSIDMESNKVKLSSIMRDTYVSIYARGKNKINAAYLEGGPGLAIRTLNENFDLAIRDYISVDFFGSAKIIQALGGVEIDVKEDEVGFLNNYLGEIAGIDGMPVNFVKKAGLQHLDGKQAVAYSRIRAVGRGDYGRINRQALVMSALMKSIQEKKNDFIAIVLKDIVPNIETNLDYAQLFEIGTNLLQAKSRSLEHVRFPLDNASKGIMIDKIWYLSADLAKTRQSLHNYIYKDVYPE